MESAAKSLLRQAVELDGAGRKVQALTCYTEGIALLMDIKQGSPSPSPPINRERFVPCREGVTEPNRREALEQRLREYLGRAEKLKALVEKDKKGRILPVAMCS